MTAVLLWLTLAVIAATVTARATTQLAVSAPVRRLNYRGLSVPSAAGFAIVLGLIAAASLAALLYGLFDSARLAAAYRQSLDLVLVAAAFGLLGLWDDLAGTSEERGWRAHLTALRHGRASAGAIKLAGGGALAFVIGSGTERSLAWGVLAALCIALSANAFNLLDVRPGRCCKVALVASLALILAPGRTAVAPLVAVVGAILGFMTFDLRERAMLGDTGAMALGAIVGLGIVRAGHLAEVIALGVLIVMHLTADRPGLSAIIHAFAPLRAFDRAGRVPE